MSNPDDITEVDVTLSPKYLQQLWDGRVDFAFANLRLSDPAATIDHAKAAVEKKHGPRPEVPDVEALAEATVNEIRGYFPNAPANLVALIRAVVLQMTAEAVLATVTPPCSSCGNAVEAERAQDVQPKCVSCLSVIDYYTRKEG